MRDEKKAELVEKANKLISAITAKKISQVDISTLTGIHKATLSKLKGVEYFPSKGEAMIEQLEKLAEELENHPKSAMGPLFKQKAEKGKVAVFFYCLVPLILGLLLGALFFKKEIPVERPKSIVKTFETLFESDMQAAPYSINTKLPCYKYQNKWSLDETAPYTIVLPLNEGIYYYRSKSVSWYAWCEIGNKEGDQLDALELFTNELWLDTLGRLTIIDSLKHVDFVEDGGFLKLAEVSSIFSDIIEFGYNEEKGFQEPVKREGKRIARFKPFIAPDYKNQVEDVLDNYISILRKTKCDSVLVEGNAPDSMEDLFLQFNCTFFNEDNAGMEVQPYSKRIKKPKKLR